MKEFLIRLLKRSIPVVIVLSALGYMYAQILCQFMVPHDVEISGTAEDIRVTPLPVPVPEGLNQILWKTPLLMSLYGVGILFVSELLAALVRKQRKQTLEGRLVHSIAIPKPIPAPDHLATAPR